MSKINQCVECGACIRSCDLLMEIGISPKKLNARGITAKEAFACSLCGKCESVCHYKLSPRQLFWQARIDVVQNRDYPIEEFVFLYPDRSNNLNSVYRKHAKINYDDILVKDECNVCFFPGCALMTYSPELTRVVYDKLKTAGNCKGIWLECCGIILRMLGLVEREKALQAKLLSFVKEHEIKTIVVACANCYYAMKDLFASHGVAIKTVYEIIPFKDNQGKDSLYYTLHDACPDRQAGIFADQVRQAFIESNHKLVEMKHNRKNGGCCGSGGQLAITRPDLSAKLVADRAEEALRAQADVLVPYCMSCAARLGKNTKNVPVSHALNVLLAVPDEYEYHKAALQKLLTGKQKDEIWQEIISDE